MTRKRISTLFSSSPRALTSTSSSSFSSFLSSHTTPSSPQCSFSGSILELGEIIKNAESIIKAWDLDSSPYTNLFQHHRKDAKEFLTSVKNLRSSMDFLVSQESASDMLVLSQNLMQIAMKRLEHEFYRVLTQNRSKLHPESVLRRSTNGSINPDNDEYDSDSHEDELKGDAIEDLKAIAECMISFGYGKECAKIYKLMRKSIVDEVLYQLGIERLRASQFLKMKQEAIEFMMKNWVRALRIAVKTLFNGEKVTCNYVFSVSQKLRDSCFCDITKEGAINLFRFPQLIAETKSKKPQEVIFGIMELHKAVTELWPEIESLFNSELTSGIKIQVLSLQEKLGESIRSILLDFEATIQKDSSKTIVAGGGIHPLTKSSIDFISLLGEYGETLDKILTHYPLPGSPTFQESYFESPSASGNDCMKSAASVHFAWLLLVLFCKLDTKAKLYKDVSLSYIFLANNLRYIVEKVQTSHLKGVLGDEWVLRHDQKIKQFALNYETMAWSRVFSTLPGHTSSAIMILPEEAKECFRKFSAAFEEAYMKQTSWIIPDQKLRDEIKGSIAKKLVPAYREFYDRYMVTLCGEKNLEALARFGPDDLETHLSALFDGSPTSGSSSSSYSSSSRSSYGCIPH